MNRSASPLDIALSMIARGWAPIPVPFKSKKPVHQDWPTLRITASDAPDYFNGKAQNVGVLLGPASNGLVDVDLDCPEAVAVASYFLPRTGAIFGRPSNRASHWLYRSGLASEFDGKAIEYHDPSVEKNAKGSMLLELRIGGGAKGAQTIMPGSTHESGEVITWEQHDDPAEIGGPELRERAGRAAAAALLARRWSDGIRHQAALVLGGLLARAGWSSPNVKLFVEAVARAGGDPEVKDRVKAAEDAYDAFAKGDNAYGYPKLKDLFGDRVADRVCEWLGYVPGTSTDDLGIFAEKAKAAQTIVEEFNAKFMVVNEAGKAVIFQPGFDPVLKRRRYDRLSVRDLQTLYMNQLTEIGTDEKGHPIKKPAADVWLRHPDRRQFINGVTFDPTAKQQDGVLNLWEGFAVDPIEGDWSLMRAHVEKVICDRDPVRFDYLMGWMARLLQRPAEQGEVAVVMRGGEGTGKGTLAKALMTITGHHGLAISNAKHLTGNFNAHLRDVVFLFADEAFFAGDRSHVGVLKSLITEPYLTVEGKFQNAVQTPNFLHVMMASNEDWVVPASQDARRFFVLDVSETVKGDHAYFGRIWAQMSAGGFEAMLHDLLAYDLASFNVRAVPTTDGLQHQRKLSLPTTEAWWLDCLQREYIFRSKLGLESEFAKWHDRVTVELVFASYVEFAKGRNERRLLTREDLGKFLKTMGAVACRWRNGILGEHVTDVSKAFGGTNRKAAPVKHPDRATAYFLGDLSQVRAFFIRETGLAMNWSKGHEIDVENVAA